MLASLLLANLAGDLDRNTDDLRLDIEIYIQDGLDHFCFERIVLVVEDEVDRDLLAA